MLTINVTLYKTGRQLSFGCTPMEGFAAKICPHGSACGEFVAADGGGFSGISHTLPVASSFIWPSEGWAEILDGVKTRNLNLAQKRKLESQNHLLFVS